MYVFMGACVGMGECYVLCNGILAGCVSIAEPVALTVLGQFGILQVKLNQLCHISIHISKDCEVGQLLLLQQIGCEVLRKAKAAQQNQRAAVDMEAKIFDADTQPDTQPDAQLSMLSSQDASEGDVTKMNKGLDGDTEQPPPEHVERVKVAEARTTEQNPRMLSFEEENAWRLKMQLPALKAAMVY